jgi:4-hydroxybenzoate polyprenyltransferase
MWSRGSRTLAILAMTHPTGVLVFGASVPLLCLIAQRLTFDPGLCLRLTVAVMSAHATSGVINDLFDLDLDRAAKPWRALPAQLISVRGACAFAAALLVVGVVSSALVSATSCLLLILGVATSAVYSAGAKRTPFSWLPYLVAYPSLPVWIWISTGEFRSSIIAVYAIGAPLVVGIHMVNQLRDFKEDDRLGVKGLVHALGRARSTALCYALVAVAPIPPLLAGLHSPRTSAAWATAGAALIHWVLLLPMIMRPDGAGDAERFRRMFRALQLSGPLLLCAWLLQV